jgi:hypothetical protein
MQRLNFMISSCRHCQFYQLEGRRGGQCQQLGVPVQAAWKACQLAIPPFAPSWEGLDGVAGWQKETVGVQGSLTAGGTLPLYEGKSASLSEGLTPPCTATPSVAPSVTQVPLRSFGSR